MAKINDSNLNRRQMLKTSLAGASAIALGACSSNLGKLSQSIKQTGYVISDQELNQRKYELKQRMRFRMDSGDVVWSLSGKVYAQKEGVLMPLFNLLHCSFARIEPRQAGGFDMLSYELGFRTDLKTGERLSQFANPFNGEINKIPFAPVGPIEIQYTPEIELVLPEDIGGSRIVYEEQPDIYRQESNHLYLDQMTHGKVMTIGKSDRHINEFTTIYGATKNLTDKSQNFVATQGFHSDVADYPRWMKMSREFGSQTLRAMSKKGENREHISKEWMDIVKTIDPEIYKNPMSVLDRDKARYLG